ncbi:hypothetical protein [uncultured Limosilactobacillus sp.]|uniref:hypothetical protein n=1 Tax=uncultured Limosilactobacillus sp. TaxID=2837629 RepID=UPI0025EE83E0|nr:hypothetical protein [uncultured Limosilactobacillus sp.]
MENLTIKSTIENTITAISKYCRTTMGVGNNVFFYMPSLFRTRSDQWVFDENGAYLPLNYLVETGKPQQGTLSITMKLWDKIHNEDIQTVVLDAIPLGRPFYNRSYLVPVGIYQRKHYYGVGFYYPQLAGRAQLDITEQWKLSIAHDDHEYQFKRHLSMPIALDPSVKPNDLKINESGQNFYRDLITYDNQLYQAAVKDVIAPVKNYNYVLLDNDKSYNEFGSQSIVIGRWPRLTAFYVPSDGWLANQLMVYNQQPRINSTISRFNHVAQWQEIIRVLRNRGMIDEEFGEMLESADSMTQFYTAFYNLCNQSGTQFIKIDGLPHDNTLDVNFPEFHVAEA